MDIESHAGYCSCLIFRHSRQSGVRLTRLGLKGFRAYRDVSFELPSAGVVLIAGPNNAGKSSLLAALDVVAGREHMPHSSWHINSSSPRIAARFSLSDLDRKSIVPPAYPEGLAPNWLEWEFTAAPDGAPFICTFSGSWSDDEEPLVLAAVEPDPAHPGRSWTMQRHWPSVSAHSLAPPLSRTRDLPNYSFGLDPAPEVMTVPNRHLNRWRGDYFRFPALRPGTTRTRQLQQATVLSQTGENLPAVLLDLQNNRPNLWHELQQLIAQVVPDVGRLALRPSNTEVEVVFEDQYVAGLRHNLKDLGAGVEQLLLMLVVGVAMPEAMTVAVEEPETGLHPAAQRALLGLLHTWSRDRLFMMTTHSSVLLDTEPGMPTVLAVSRVGSESVVSQMRPRFHDLYEDLGVRLSDVLSADRILIVEGTSDKEVLFTWLPELKLDPRVAVIIGEGGRNARHAAMLNAWLQQADRLERRVLYIRDRDELTAEQITRFEQDPTVHVLPHRELENYFLDQQALATYFSSLEPAVDVSPEQLEKELRTAADSLKQLVITKAVCQTLDTIRLADDQLRRRLSKGPLDVEALVAAVLERIPEPASVATQIRTSWRDVEKEIDERWSEEWRAMAPGEEVLNELFRRHLGRRFVKDRDGPALARRVRPARLLEIIASFMKRDVPGTRLSIE